MIIELLHGMKGPDIALLLAIFLGAPVLIGILVASVWQRKDRARYKRMVYLADMKRIHKHYRRKHDS
jgi:FtsZ-interacting cell division protein ZipA